MKLAGMLIRRERLRRSWSQGGLCKGICAVSYLSKIEQGKTGASPDVLRLLFARLELTWLGADEAAEALIERSYRTLFSGNEQAFPAAGEALLAQRKALECSEYALDVPLLSAFLNDEFEPAEPEMEPFMSVRQLALQRVLQQRFDDALRLYPAPYFQYLLGQKAYCDGQPLPAIEALRRAHDTAAEQGFAYIMLNSRMMMGNCYSNLLDRQHMLAHYAVAEQLADALRDTFALKSIRYNIAATNLECGHVREAYAYFSGLPSPSVMDLHKLAICCEKLGRPQEALAALEAAKEAPDTLSLPDLAKKMCGLVRYRLTQPDYLHAQAYGSELLSCFAEIREKLPYGYASFHLPWVLEWYRANRQYKEAFSLLQDFPQQTE
mgnify:CR=1 FL=1